MKSLGSQALGACLVALTAVAAQLARRNRDDNRDDNRNIVCCLLIGCVDCVVECVGDAMEYLGEWAYVQVALRGVGLCEAVEITGSTFNGNGMQSFLADLLLKSVVNLGTIAMALVAGGIALLFGWSLAGMDQGYVCLAFGLVAGLAVGNMSMGILGCGVKTVLVCWTLDEQRMTESGRYRGLAAELSRRRLSSRSPAMSS